MPPRSPTSRPASRASSSRGRTPVAKITTSTSMEEPSLKTIFSTAIRPLMAEVAVPTRTSTSMASMRRLSDSPPPSSTWRGISLGANSTTVVSAPSFFSAPAASRPNRPPPMTAPLTRRFGLRSCRVST